MEPPPISSPLPSLTPSPSPSPSSSLPLSIDPTPFDTNQTQLCYRPHTDLELSTNSSCYCYSPFYGDYCEGQVSWWVPLVEAYRVEQLMVFSLTFYWALLKLISVKATGRLRLNPATFALLLVLVASTLRCAALMFPPPAITLDYEAHFSDKLTPVTTVIFTMPSTLLMMANSMLAGFWADILYREKDLKMAMRTKVISFCMAVLVALSLIGLLISEMVVKNSLIYRISLVLISLPIVIAVIALCTITLVVYRKRMVLLGDIVKARYTYAVRWLVVSALGWVVFVVSLTIWVLVDSTPQYKIYGSKHYEAFMSILNWFGLTFSTISILCLVDRYEGPLSLSRWAFCHGKLSESSQEERQFNTLRFDDSVTVDSLHEEVSYEEKPSTISTVSVRETSTYPSQSRPNSHVSFTSSSSASAEYPSYQSVSASSSCDVKPPVKAQPPSSSSSSSSRVSFSDSTSESLPYPIDVDAPDESFTRSSETASSSSTGSQYGSKSELSSIDINFDSVSSSGSEQSELDV